MNVVEFVLNILILKLCPANRWEDICVALGDVLLFLGAPVYICIYFIYKILCTI